METLRYVVLTNFLLAIMSLAYYVLLRRETFFSANRFALWFGLAAALVLPLLELPDWRPQPVRTVMQRTAQAIVPKVLPKTQYDQPEITITFPDQKSYQAFQNQPEKLTWSWQTELIGLYISVVFLLFIRFGVQLMSLRKLIQQSVQEAYDDFTLIHSKGITSPFSFFDWVFINPNQHTPEELEQVLRHERVHVRERHSSDMIGVEMVCILFWFNPAAYLFRHLVHQTLEFSADRAVLSEGVDTKIYQYNLLKVSLLTSQSTIANHFSASSLSRRITMMNSSRSSLLACWRYLLLLTTLISISFACQLTDTTSSHKYTQQSNKVLFSLITAKTSKQDFDTLRQELNRRNIKLNISQITRLVNGQIQQIALTIETPKPGRPIDAVVGSSIGKSPIPAIGLQCDETGCQLSAVDDQFPKRLQNLAIQENNVVLPESSREKTIPNNANSVFGLYSVFFGNDFLESNYFGLRSTAVHMTQDYQLALYPEFQKAVVFLDGQEVSRRELARFNVLDLKKVVVFRGETAVLRLGDVRARFGLILLSRLPNMAIRDKYAATPLLKIAYPELFTQP